MRSPRLRSQGLLAAALVLAAVTVSSCSPGTSASHSESVREVVKTNASLFTVDVSAGSLRLAPGPAGHVSLQGTVTYRGDQRPTLLWENTSAQLSLRSICHSRDQRCQYDYTFTVPVSTRVAASVTAGDLSARGLTGPLQLGSTAGDVTLSRLSGPINVSSTAGNVTASDLRERSTYISEGAGNVSLGFTAAPSRLFVKDSTGNVDVVVPNFARYHVSTSDNLGNVSTNVPDDTSSPDTISLSVGTGNVLLNYPSSNSSSG
jgi:hypothetical protein